MKKIVAFISLFFPLAELLAQGFLTSNQVMVKVSVEQSVVITCSGYKLQDSTGRCYGRNNRNEFSQSYSLAVVTDSGLIIPASVISPWDYDSDFERYRSSHSPVLNSVRFRQLGDSVYSNLQLSVDSTSSPQLFRMSTNSMVRLPQLSVHTDTTYNNGWLLWVYASDTIGDVGVTSTTAVIAPSSISDTVPGVQMSAPIAASLMQDSTASRKPIGAVWVVPNYPQPGMVQFRVAGLVVRDGVKWQLVPLRFSNGSDTTVSSPETDGELTPAPDPQQPQRNKNKKNRRNK